MSTRKDVQQDVKIDKKLLQLGEDKLLTKKKYRALLKENARLEAELEASYELKKERRLVRIKSRERRKDSEATAIALLSDLHIEEEVLPSQVNYMNKFNLDIAEYRVKQYFERVVRLIKKEEQDVKIHELVLCILGDLTTGRLHEENLETCLLRPVEAMIFAQDLIIAGLTFLQEHLKQNITVVCKVGNHGRLTRKIHHGTERGNNLEWMLYHNLQARFPDIKFVIEDSYHTYIKVYDKMLRIHHGHNVRYGGGVGGLSIPLNKAIHQWNLTKTADIDLMG